MRQSARLFPHIQQVISEKSSQFDSEISQKTFFFLAFAMTLITFPSTPDRTAEGLASICVYITARDTRMMHQGGNNSPGVVWHPNDRLHCSAPLLQGAEQCVASRFESKISYHRPFFASCELWQAVRWLRLHFHSWS